MLIRKYFTYTSVFFLLSFLLFPTSKLVNSYYYLTIAVPSLFYFLINPKKIKPLTLIEYLWLSFILYCFLYGLLLDHGFAKYVLYVYLFVSVSSRLIISNLYIDETFIRAAFWLLIAYVLLSTAWYAAIGSYHFGDRIVDLPSRLDGPIFTSILISSSLVLITPVWVRQCAIWEAISGLILAVICVAVILQSRTGIVGLLLWGGGLGLFILVKHKSKVLVLAIATALLVLTLLIYTLLDSNELFMSLFSRGDSGRFEIWQYFLINWYECGLFYGCGLDFEMDVPVRNQTILHSHNIFLSLGVSLGLIPLLLFISLMLMALYLAVKQKNWWGGYLAMALVLCNLDGAQVINSPNELWLLIWLPLGLLINDKLANSRSQEYDK